MTAPSWDSKELARLREYFQQLERELKTLDFRLRELEHLAARALAAPLPGAPSLTRPMVPAVPDTTAEALTPAKEAAIDVVAATPAASDDTYRLAPEPPPPHPYKQYVEPLPSRRAASDAGARRPARARQSIDWETAVGGRWMTWIGAFTLLLALGFTVQWAWSTFQTPPWLQALAFHLLGVGLLVGGHVIHRRGMPPAARAVAGLGVFTLYASAFAALHLYKLWSPQTAFIECAAITVLTVGIALAADSWAVVLLGALGGYLTPILTSTGSANYVGLFTYLAFLNVALVACAVWRGWSFLKPLALAATVLMFLAWIGGSAFDAGDIRIVWNTQWFAALHALIFLVGSTIPPLAWKRVTVRADVMALSGASFFFVGITWALFHDQPDQQMALVCWGMALLHAVLFGITYARLTNVDRMPRIHLALATVFFTLAIPLQLDNPSYQGATWCVEGLVFTSIGVYFLDRQMCTSGLIVFLLAATRLVAWDVPSPPRTIGDTAIDMRFAMFMVSGLMTLLARTSYRLIPWAFEREIPAGRWFTSIADFLSVLGVGLVTVAQPLQLSDWAWLGPAWAIEGLIFAAIGVAVGDRLLCALAATVFMLAAGRGLGWDFASPPRLLDGLNVDARFAAIAASGVLAMLAGAFFWLIPKLTGRSRLDDKDRAGLGGLLLAGGNIVLLLSMCCQWDTWYPSQTPFFGGNCKWDSRLVLALWTLDAALIWAIAFRRNIAPARWYAFALAIVFVGGRALLQGDWLDGPYRLLANARFGSLALVSALYFGAGWMYRQRLTAQQRTSSLGDLMQTKLSQMNEALLDPVLGILANVVLVVAISLEIDSWYAAAASAGYQPFPNMRMAEMATYSIVWAIYAAVVVAVGFALRYPLFRMLGLIAFGPILLKVFFIDLSSLQWLPRILALAVLGLMLLGVSMLYQKFAARVQSGS